MPDKAKKIFADNLRYLLLSSSLTQVDFAEKLKLKTSTLSDWINGRKYPRVDSMQVIADYFNISMSDLMSENLSFVKKATPMNEGDFSDEQQKAISLLEALPAEKKQEALRYLEYLVSQQDSE